MRRGPRQASLPSYRKEATEKQHLHSVEKLATEAVTKLFVNGLFRSHPAKPYYESTNGVGLLLVALLELDKPDQPQRGAF